MSATATSATTASTTPPRRVVVGACGMGNGHSSRQLSLVAELRRRGHRVAMITFGDGTAALDGAFPADVPLLEPDHHPGAWVAAGAAGLDIAASARNGRRLGRRDDAWNFALCERVTAALDGEPDVVITDYEPASAQLAYMLGRPLATVEQQSKFLIHRTPDVGGATRWQEAAKLRYFFPAADHRVASSFFPMEWERDERYPGEVVQPILRPEVTALAADVEHDPDLVVVYLSPYGPLGQRPEELLASLATQPTVRFEVFTRDPAPLAPHAPANVTLAAFDRARFTSSLARCSAVVSTTGHQLLSECLYLGKPVLGLPFDTYEQRFNAMMLAHMGFGVEADKVTPEGLTAFLERRAEYAANAREQARRRFTDDAVTPAVLDRLGL